MDKFPSCLSGLIKRKDRVSLLTISLSSGDIIFERLEMLNPKLQKYSDRFNELIDIGNKAAHGDFAAYSQDEVKRMLEGIEQFLANHFV
jgi:hypothetical protein